MSVYVRPPPTPMPGEPDYREARHPRTQLPRARVHGVSLVHQLVREVRASPAQAARLLELRRVLAWRRLPWWQRAGIVLWRAVFA